MLGPLRRPLLILTFTPGLAACEPTEPCLTTIELLDYKDQTPLGISAAEAFERLDLPFVGPMGYTDEYPAKPGLQGMTTTAQLTIAYAQGEVRFIDQEDNPDYREGRFNTLELDGGERCPDRVEVDFDASFVTDDGRFDEAALPGVMTISTNPWPEDQDPAIHVEFRTEIDFDNLQGSFSPELVEDDLRKLVLSWGPGFADAQDEPPATGMLSSEVSSGDSVGVGMLAWLGSNPFSGEN